MLREERSAVHLEGEQRLRTRARPARRGFARRRARAPTSMPRSGPGEDELDGLGPYHRRLEHVAKGSPAPAGGTDAVLEPGLADGPVRRPGTPVPGALHRDQVLDGGKRPEVRERQRPRLFDEPADREPPLVRLDRGQVVVGEQVVEARRRDRVPQRLERQPVVSLCLLELGEHEDVGHGACLSTGFALRLIAAAADTTSSTWFRDAARTGDDRERPELSVRPTTARSASSSTTGPTC